MDSYTRLINILKSEEFKNYIYTYYQEYIDKLNKELKKPEVFMKYCRAFIMDIYFKYDYEQRELLADKIEHDGLTETEVDFLVFRLNACMAKPNDHIDKDSEEFFEELAPYKDSKIAKSLEKYRKEIFSVLSREMGVFTIKQIKEGNYYIPQREPGERRMGEYIIGDDEIETIEAAHKASLLVDIGHSLYDDVEYTQRPSILGGIEIDKRIKCDYEKADIDGLGNFVFDTLKDAPKIEVDIVFEDGIMMKYHLGNIRKEPYTIDEMMAYIYADITRLLEEEGYDEKNIDTIDSHSFDMIIEDACIEISAQTDFLSEIYSKKMIDKAKQYIKRLTKIAQDENL